MKAIFSFFVEIRSRYISFRYLFLELFFGNLLIHKLIDLKLEELNSYNFDLGNSNSILLLLLSIY